jgi:hypothetical protein
MHEENKGLSLRLQKLSLLPPGPGVPATATETALPWPREPHHHAHTVTRVPWRTGYIKNKNVLVFCYNSLDETVVRRRHALPLLRSCIKQQKLQLAT